MFSSQNEITTLIDFKLFTANLSIHFHIWTNGGTGFSVQKVQLSLRRFYAWLINNAIHYSFDHLKVICSYLKSLTYNALITPLVYPGISIFVKKIPHRPIGPFQVKVQMKADHLKLDCTTFPMEPPPCG